MNVNIARVDGFKQSDFEAWLGRMGDMVDVVDRRGDQAKAFQIGIVTSSPVQFCCDHKGLARRNTRVRPLDF